MATEQYSSPGLCVSRRRRACPASSVGPETGLVKQLRAEVAQLTAANGGTFPSDDTLRMMIDDPGTETTDPGAALEELMEALDSLVYQNLLDHAPRAVGYARRAGEQLRRAILAEYEATQNPPYDGEHAATLQRNTEAIWTECRCGWESAHHWIADFEPANDHEDPEHYLTEGALEDAAEHFARAARKDS